MHSRSLDARLLITNHTLLFTGSRYVGFAILFVRGMLVAKFLGPHLFGVWGFLTLAQQYFSYTSLGLQYAINVELATDASADSERQARAIGVTLGLTLLIGGLLIGSGLVLRVCDIGLFDKYSLGHYVLALAVITALTHLRHVLTNIYRAHGQLARIAAGELAVALFPFLVVLAFRGEQLVSALLVAMGLSEVVCLAIFLTRTPFRIPCLLDPGLAKHLLRLAIPLLIFNASIYLIVVSARTVVSLFYPVAAMGYYSLANSIANVTLLGLSSAVWAVYPTLLFRARDGLPDETVTKTVEEINDLYGTAVFLTVLVAIVGVPLVFRLLPEYQPAEGILAILLLSQGIRASCFGYSCMAIARRQQSSVARIGMTAAATAAGLGLLVGFFKFHYLWVAMSVLAGSFVFALLQARLGSHMLRRGSLRNEYSTSVLSFGTLAATVIVVFGSVMGNSWLGGLFGLAVFLLTRKEKLGLLWSFGVRKVMQSV